MINHFNCTKCDVPISWTNYCSIYFPVGNEGEFPIHRTISLKHFSKQIAKIPSDNLRRSVSISASLELEYTPLNNECICNRSSAIYCATSPVAPPTSTHVYIVWKRISERKFVKEVCYRGGRNLIPSVFKLSRLAA